MVEGWNFYATRNCAETKFLYPSPRDPYSWTFLLIHFLQKTKSYSHFSPPSKPYPMTLATP